MIEAFTVSNETFYFIYNMIYDALKIMTLKINENKHIFLIINIVSIISMPFIYSIIRNYIYTLYEVKQNKNIKNIILIACAYIFIHIIYTIIYGFVVDEIIIANLTILLILISEIDIMTHEIPDMLSIPLIATGLILSPFETDMNMKLWGIIIATTIMYFAFFIISISKNIDAIATGDLFLYAGGMSWLGIKYISIFILLSSVLFIISAIPNRIKNENWTPMAPSISSAIIIVALISKKSFT